MANALVTKGVAIGGGAFLLKVTEDQMEAVLVRQEAGAELPDGATLRNELESAGVVHGILDQPEPRGGDTWVVARGQAAVHGANARLRFFVKPSLVRSPKVRGSGKAERVDFRELGGIVNVKAGQLLFEKLAPTSGTPGRTVLGKVLPAKDGRDAKVKLGPGVRPAAGKGERYEAEIYGKFVMADDKASVYGEHIVNSDVDLATGNIAFAGDSLVINGTVLPGFKVRCRGSVFIAKGVNDARILAGGGVTINGGLVGERARVTARSTITVDFCENGPHLSTASSVVVKDTIIQATVTAGGDLKAVSGKGQVVGGSYTLGGSLWARELGSEAQVVTEVTVGLAPSLARRQEELAAGQALWPQRMNDTLKAITGLTKLKKESGGKLPPDKEELLAKYQAFLPKVTDKVNRLTALEEELAAEVDRAADQAVYVLGPLHPGVRLQIGNAKRVITVEEEGVAARLHRQNLEIVTKKLTEDEAAMFHKEET